MLEMFRFAKSALVENWEDAPNWGLRFMKGARTGGCLYTKVTDKFGLENERIAQFSLTLAHAIGLPMGTGFYWTFDQPDGRERVLEAIERVIAQLEEHEAVPAVPEGSDSNQVAPHAFAGCGLEPVT